MAKGKSALQIQNFFRYVVGGAPRQGRNSAARQRGTARLRIRGFGLSGNDPAPF